MEALKNKFKDGTSYEYKVTGLLEDSDHSEAWTECEDVKPEDVGGIEIPATDNHQVVDGDGGDQTEDSPGLLVPGAITES
ncbi:hypothetical protein FALCPG4_007978 [Fusarium falciforme]